MLGKSPCRMESVGPIILRTIIFFAVAIALAVVSFRLFPKDADIHWKGEETAAVVKRIDVAHSRFSPLPFYVIQYRYKIDGKYYTGKGQLQNIVSLGDLITVKYLPTNPRRSFIPGSVNFAPVLVAICAALASLNSAFMGVARLIRLSTAPPTASFVMPLNHLPAVKEDTVNGTTISDVMPDWHRR